MSKLTTEGIKVGGIPKQLSPGNHSCKINAIELKPFSFKPGSFHMILHLEGPAQPADFEGFFINKDNESLGRYKGQVGQVKVSEWAYADGETKTGTPINRDTEILKAIKGIAISLGVLEELKAFEKRHTDLDTIEEYVAALSAENPFKNKFMQYCIAGKEYLNKQGYTNYDLYLPKFSKTGVPYGTSKVFKFNEELHIIKKKVEVVNEFETQDDGLSSTTLPQDFNLDAETN